ncbi:MAG: hypothetical protein J5733_03070 [Bacteroidaceae bacterium]|nr:hypothetical protein [Bacteroidaceae bacterium]
MKNIKLFQEIQERSKVKLNILRKTLEQNKKDEDDAYKVLRDDKENEQNREAFHEKCSLRRKLEREIEMVMPFCCDRWYMTEHLYSDARAYEVVEVYTPDKMDVRKLKATITPEAQKKLHESFIPGGFCGHFDNSLQEWTFESDDKNPIITVRRHKDGKFYRANSRTCPFYPTEEPYEWYDYNF